MFRMTSWRRTRRRLNAQGLRCPSSPAAKTPWSWKTTASRRRISNLIRDRHHHQLQRLRHLPRHPQTIGGAAVKAIGPKAFAQHTYIALAELPEGLETIGDNAFYNCETLARVVFPSTLKSIGDYAFYNAYGSNVLELPSVEHIGAYAFYAIGVTDALELPEGLKTIGDSAFENCRNMGDLYLPSTLGSDWFQCVQGRLQHSVRRFEQRDPACTGRKRL